MVDWVDDLLSALPFSLGRVANAAWFAGLGSFFPAALLSGSGGHGDGFHEVRFIGLVAAAVVSGAVIGALTAPRHRHRD